MGQEIELFPILRDAGIQKTVQVSETNPKIITTKDTKVHKGNPILSALLCSISPNGRGLYRHRSFVLTLFIWTRNYRTCLQEFLHQIFVAATGALFRNWLVGGGELAIWIISTAIESISLSSPLFDQVTLFAERTLHSDEVLLHVLAFRISAASGEFAVAAVADHHIPSALWAHFV